MPNGGGKYQINTKKQCDLINSIISSFFEHYQLYLSFAIWLRKQGMYSMSIQINSYIRFLFNIHLYVSSNDTDRAEIIMLNFIETSWEARRQRQEEHATTLCNHITLNNLIILVHEIAQLQRCWESLVCWFEESFTKWQTKFYTVRVISIWLEATKLRKQTSHEFRNDWGATGRGHRGTEDGLIKIFIC